jgi:hypothetical protein
MDPTENMQGFGESSMEELVELRKALSIGYQQPTTGQGFDALRVESLDATLKTLTYTQQHVKLWSAINKTDAYSSVRPVRSITPQPSSVRSRPTSLPRRPATVPSG